MTDSPDKREETKPRVAGSTSGVRFALKPSGRTALTRYIGYSVAIVSFSAGLIFVTGVFLPPTIPKQLRIMFGVVFLLMGIYRYFATRYKIKAFERGDV